MTIKENCRKNHGFEHSGYKINKNILISLGEYGEILITIRSNVGLQEIQSFSVSYIAEYNGKKYTIRRHCWMENHSDFHTHVRVGFGKRKYKKIYPTVVLKNKNVTIKKALKWAEDDIKINWFNYRQCFEKMVKLFIKDKNEK